MVCEFHLGEFVNRFRRGSLTMQMREAGAEPLPTMLYGSVNGVVGVVAPILSVKHLHENGVAHRDIKASTLMLTGDGGGLDQGGDHAEVVRAGTVHHEVPGFVCQMDAELPGGYSALQGSEAV